MQTPIFLGYRRVQFMDIGRKWTPFYFCYSLFLLISNTSACLKSTKRCSGHRKTILRPGFTSLRAGNAVACTKDTVPSHVLINSCTGDECIYTEKQHNRPAFPRTRCRLGVVTLSFFSLFKDSERLHEIFIVPQHTSDDTIYQTVPDEVKLAAGWMWVFGYQNEAFTPKTWKRGDVWFGTCRPKQFVVWMMDYSRFWAAREHLCWETKIHSESVKQWIRWWMHHPAISQLHFSSIPK